MRYYNDPLLKSNELLLEKNVLNLYSALVKVEDFESKRPLSSIPYLTCKTTSKIEHLITNRRIKDFEDYLQQKIRKKTIKYWINHNIIPFPFLRVISLQHKDSIKKLSDYIIYMDNVTTNQRKTSLKLPKIYSQLLSDDTLYFYGYLLGDGCISKNKIIKLCDGHPKTEYLCYSFDYLCLIQKFLKNKFNLYSKLSKDKKKCDLTVVSKYFSRFLKFFYGYKKDKGLFIIKPKIISDNTPKSKIFYRGFFDADSGIKEKDKFLTLKSKDKKFLESCKSDFAKYSINTSRITCDNFNISFFKIYAHNLYDYAKNIGFHHPRKQKLLSTHLKKGCLIKKLDSVDFNNLTGKFYNLSKIPRLRLIGVADIFKKYRQRLGTQRKVAIMLDTFRENVKRWENGTSSIPFCYYSELMKLAGFTLEETLNNLSKRTVLFGQGRIKQSIKLPIIFKNSDLKIIGHLTPAKTKVIVKSYGINNRYLFRGKIFDQIEEFFGIKIYKDTHSYILSSNLLSSFIRTFYKYINSWDPLPEEKINKLRKDWNVLF